MESPTDKGISMDENMDTGQQKMQKRPAYDTYPIQCSSNGNTDGGESYHIPRRTLLNKLKELHIEGTMAHCKLLPLIGKQHYLQPLIICQ